MTQTRPAMPAIAPEPPARERRRSPEDTRERLLDAAERLFAERGFDGASLRAVTQAAGTSVSAAHYHFGSKEALLAATIRRHAEPVLEARFARLDRLQRESGGQGLGVEAVIDAFLRPTFEERAAHAHKGDAFRRIAARLFSDPPDVVASLKREVFGSTFERFVGVLAEALPHKSRAEVALDLQFLVGIMVHVMSGHLEDAPSVPGGGSLAELSDEAVLHRMVTFVAAGLRASGVRDAMR